MTLMDIKEQIRKHGKTLREVAFALGKSEQNFGQQIGHNPTITLLEDVAKVCGCSLSDFLKEDNSMPQEITLKINGQEGTYQLKQSTDEKD